ncbi:hypothetical protein B0O80DRAFT_500915 [Mortierella sp. GBAus27b]|nr:hypothetical protein B0O80DRAFT_500915 [Mortierella sp. GBAus27b]
MAEATTSAMELPEIRHYVAQFLDRSELAVVTRVCKSWNGTFTPFLYRQIVVCAYDRDITIESFKANTDYVRSLEFSQRYLRSLSRDFPLEAFTRLTSFTLRFDYGDPHLMLTRLVQMLPQNPAIQDLTIFNYNTDPYNMEFMQTDTDPYNMEFMQTVASSCLNLQTLSVLNSHLNVECTKLLLDICVCLTELKLDYTVLDGALGTEDVDRWPDGFPKLCRLHVSLQGRWNILRIVQKCPQLKSLTCDMNYSKEDMSDLPDVIAKHCPCLDELKILKYRDAPIDLARVLDSCSRLSSLTLGQHGLYLSAQSSLTRHYPHLTHVDFHSCFFVQSAIVHQILISCPHLDYLSATKIHVCDILGVPHLVDVPYLRLGEPQPEFLELESRPDGMRPQEWVCTKLRTLEVSFYGFQDKPSMWHRLVLDQLGRLTKLEVLCFNRSWRALPSDGLCLRLGTGLDLLSGMNNLRILVDRGSCQQWDENDVQWMVTTWTRLQEIKGKMHSDHSKDESLRRILENSYVKWTW